MLFSTGMGLPTITAARKLLAQMEGLEIPEANLQWDHFHNVALVKVRFIIKKNLSLPNPLETQGLV